MPNSVSRHCSGQHKDASAAEPGVSQHWQRLQHPSQSVRSVDNLHVQDEVRHSPASAITDEHIAQAVQDPPARQQQSHDASLPLCTPLTQLSQGEACSFDNAHPAGMLSGEDQILRCHVGVRDLPSTRRPKGDAGFSSNSMDCAVDDAAQPVSQVLPDTAMELWDFGGEEPPEPNHAAAGAGDDSKAAEALQELEDFCRSELSAGSSHIPAGNQDLHLLLCAPAL